MDSVSTGSSRETASKTTRQASQLAPFELHLDNREETAMKRRFSTPNRFLQLADLLSLISRPLKVLFGVMSAIMFSPVSTRFLFLLKVSDSYFTF